MPSPVRFASAVALILACSFFVPIRAGEISNTDAELQFQLANLLFDETRYWEALQAFERASEAPDPALALRALKGKVRTELRVAEFVRARTDAEKLKTAAPIGSRSAGALRRFALGLRAVRRSRWRRIATRCRSRPNRRARASAWRARSSTRNHLDEALTEALAASAAAPRDGEIHALVGDIYERLHRFDEAAIAYSNYINLLPNKDRSDKAAWSRAQVQFLEAFHGLTPVEIDEQDASMLHTIPFRLVKDKIVVQARVNGGGLQDFMLDTGSEETVISRQTAERERVKPITYTLSAGVGEVGLRGLELARLKSLDIGTLQVRNLPVLIKNPALRGIPKREGESFSPLSLGMSMTIDYQNRMLTIGKTLPRGQPGLQAADARASPGDGARHAELEPPALLRRRHRRGSDLDQLRDGQCARDRADRPQDSAAGVGHVRVGSRRVPDAGDEPRLRSHRVPQLPAGRPQPARAEHPARLPGRRHRRPQVPGQLQGGDGPGEQRTAAREVLTTAG